MALPTDAELDVFIKTRLTLLGIDISVLPVSDSSAPMDQARVLSSARSTLKTTVPVISDWFGADVQEVPPDLYPAPGTAWTDEDFSRTGLRRRRRAMGL